MKNKKLNQYYKIQIIKQQNNVNNKIVIKIHKYKFKILIQHLKINNYNQFKHLNIIIIIIIIHLMKIEEVLKIVIQVQKDKNLLINLIIKI